MSTDVAAEIKVGDTAPDFTKRSTKNLTCSLTWYHGVKKFVNLSKDLPTLGFQGPYPGPSCRKSVKTPKFIGFSQYLLPCHLFNLGVSLREGRLQHSA